MRDILVVEDGLNERERLVKLFSSNGYTVTAAESSQEAETILGLETFRLAVLDIGLGDKSGSYLFELMRRGNRVPYVLILTGNPSTHLKQKFIDEGAVAYVVKGSTSAGNEALLDLTRGLLGTSVVKQRLGIQLGEFLKLYISSESRELFYDKDQQFYPCSGCGAQEYVVTFGHKTQLPPQLEAQVICAHCSKLYDPEVG